MVEAQIADQPFIKAIILANTMYENWESHRLLCNTPKLLAEWTRTKEVTIEQLVRVFSSFTTEPVEIYKNLNKRIEYVRLFSQLFIDADDSGRETIFLIGYTGHGCIATSQGFTHAILDDENGSAYNIESKMLELGRTDNISVFGVLSCCRNEATHLQDGQFGISEGTE